MQELVKLSLICGLCSTGWTESNEHVAVFPPFPWYPDLVLAMTSLTSRHTPASAHRVAVPKVRLNAQIRFAATRLEIWQPSAKEDYGWFLWTLTQNAIHAFTIS